MSDAGSLCVDSFDTCSIIMRIVFYLEMVIRYFRPEKSNPAWSQSDAFVENNPATSSFRDFFLLNAERMRISMRTRVSGGEADPSALERVDTRSPGSFINPGAELPSVEFKGTETGERDEKTGLRQSAEQADQATFHSAQGPSELRPHVRAGGNDNRDEALAQEEETLGKAEVGSTCSLWLLAESRIIIIITVFNRDIRHIDASIRLHSSRSFA